MLKGVFDSQQRQQLLLLDSPIALMPSPASNTHSLYPSTLQIIFGLSSKRYPSPDRMDGLYSESPATQGKQQCMYQLGGVSSQQSVDISAQIPNIATASPTCWLIKRIPISFLSVVNFSKASSIAALSVLLSTTRKFFCESGGAVTCYPRVNPYHPVI